MLKVDFHTHSRLSPDGGIRSEQYAQAVQDGLLDIIAITDHNEIRVAQELYAAMPENIIVGEEILTSEGEIIGLYLTERIPKGLTALQTVVAIQAQGGVVYIPHPFETVRHGLSTAVLDTLATQPLIVEVHNGRALLQNRGPQAATWTRINRAVAAAGSDAHGFKGLGATYTLLAERPTPQNLIKLLGQARLVPGRPPLRTLLYPKAHRLRNRFTGGSQQ